MTWMCLEGLDRSGKSSVADFYKKQGYKIIHMSAPDKKYFNPSYSGESYLEEIVRLYSKHDGQDVVFDRSPYGELIWPQVFGRQPLLEEEDLEYLAQMERNNNIKRVLMYDNDTEAHWQRCVQNNEPLTRQQFGRANLFYDRLVRDYGFEKKQLSDFSGFEHLRVEKTDNRSENESQAVSGSLSKVNGNSDDNANSNGATGVGESRQALTDSSTSKLVGDIEDKLERANAIRTLLQGQVLKKKGGSYDELEQAVRAFLQRELDKLFTPERRDTSFSDEEIAILKIYAKRIKEKMG